MPWKVDGQKQNTFLEDPCRAISSVMIKTNLLSHVPIACFLFENSPLLPELLVGGL